MSRSKLFNMVKARGEQKQGRNEFDLSNKHVYSQKVAKITPIKAIGTYPDDFFDIDVAEFTQNKQPMNRAAFLSGKKELLAYFVPYNSIWHNFNQFMATREDPDSTLLFEKGISYEPRMALSDMYYAAFVFFLQYYAVEKMRDWDILGYFFDNIVTESNDPLFKISVAAYHALEGSLTPASLIEWLKTTDVENIIGYSSTAYEYLNSLYIEHLKGVYSESDTLAFNYSFNSFDDFTNIPIADITKNVVGNYIWCDWCQKMDMLGYGNIYPLLSKLERSLDIEAQDRYGLYFKLGSSEVDDSTYYSDFFLQIGDVFYDYYSYESPLNLIGDTVFSQRSPLRNIAQSYKDQLMKLCAVSDDVEEYVNVYPIYAYNRCFYDYMRNVYFDTDYSPYNYNCDFISGRSLQGSIIDPGYIPLRWYHLEMHQWKKDMFTGVLPDNQLGQISEVIITSDLSSISGHTDGTNQMYRNISSDGTLNPSSAGNVKIGANGHNLLDSNDVGTLHYHSLSNTYVDIQTQGSFNVLALKRAEAIQQYRQDLMRAGNRTKDVFNQVFGITPKSELDESPYFIEVASQDINVNPIVATAQVGDGANQSLGDIAARVTLQGNNLHFKFSTKDFGVLLILSYIVPDSYYNSYRIDPFNMHLDQESHGLPYFQNLGLQPIIGSMLSNFGDVSQRNRILGYAPPYIEFKTDIDLVHCDFVDAYAAADDDAPYNPYYEGEMSPWVVARTDMQLEKAVSLRNFYINPKVLDNVFTFNAGADYQTDHFFTHSTIKVHAVRAFSELGLPHF